MDKTENFNVSATNSLRAPYPPWILFFLPSSNGLPSKTKHSEGQAGQSAFNSSVSKFMLHRRGVRYCTRNFYSKVTSMNLT